MNEIIYSSPHIIGSWGLGTLQLQQILALYDAGILKKVYCRGNSQKIIPKKYFKEFPIQDEYELDLAASKELRRDIIDGDPSFLGWNSYEQQNVLTKCCGDYTGKILKYAGSTHPIIQNGILDAERVMQRANFGVVAPVSNYKATRYTTSQCENIDHFNVASNFVKNSFVSLGFEPEKFTVQYLGVDTDFYDVQERDLKGFNIGFIGTNYFRKGLLYLLYEFDRLKIEDKSLSVVSNVRFKMDKVLWSSNNMDDVKTFYNSCNIVVLPSVEDGFAMTVLESMACGVPVMTTRMTGASEIITHGVDGFVYNNPQECAAALSQIYDMKDELPKIGEEARKTAEKYDWKFYREKFAKWARECTS